MKDENESKKSLWMKIIEGPIGPLIRQIMSFGIIGIINTLLGIILIELFYNLLHWNYWFSSISSYIIGSIYSYFANKKLTFKVKGNTKKTAVRFVLNLIVCYGIAYGVAKPLVKVVFESLSQRVVENIALLVGMGLFIVLNFFGQKFFVFRESNNHDGEESR